MAARAAYGSANPWGGVDPNADHGWGGFAWPQGVPGNLLSVVTVPGQVRIVVRKELARLVGLMYLIAQVKYGRDFSTGWTGGYENRPIAGTTHASNHSKGKAIDNDARNNPMSNIFQCDIPPGLVADWESLGWYWGGRYSGKTDTMHFEFCLFPGDVAAMEAKAEAMLSGILPHPATPATPASPAPGRIGPAPATAPTYAGRVLKLTTPFMRGSDVATMQARLNLHLTGSGQHTIDQDGVFGPKTDAAVRWYQTCRHPAPFNLTVDGKVGPATWSSLWR